MPFICTQSDNGLIHILLPFPDVKCWIAFPEQITHLTFCLVWLVSLPYFGTFVAMQNMSRNIENSKGFTNFQAPFHNEMSKIIKLLSIVYVMYHYEDEIVNVGVVVSVHLSKFQYIQSKFEGLKYNVYQNHKRSKSNLH